MYIKPATRAKGIKYHDDNRLTVDMSARKTQSTNLFRAEDILTSPARRSKCMRKSQRKCELSPYAPRLYAYSPGRRRVNGGHSSFKIPLLHLRLHPLVSDRVQFVDNRSRRRLLEGGEAPVKTHLSAAILHQPMPSTFTILHIISLWKQSLPSTICRAGRLTKIPASIGWVRGR